MPVTITQLATRYGVSTRTILRWKSQGVNVVDCLTVGRHVGKNPRVPLRVLETVANAISMECDRLDQLEDDMSASQNAFNAGRKQSTNPKP